jgi:hypothetical protein
LIRHNSSRIQEKYTAYRTTVPATYATHAIGICHHRNTEYRIPYSTEYLSTGTIEVRFSENKKKK